MTEIIDEVTGEVEDAEAHDAHIEGLPISRKILGNPDNRWHQKHADDHGLGYSGLYAAVARATVSIAATIANDARSGGRESKYSYTYATLAAVLNTVRAPLLAEGVLIRQGSERLRKLEGNGPVLMRVFTDLIHAASGQVFRTSIDVPLQKVDAQSAGSAMTYGKRYSLLAALGLATEDDDGQRATNENRVASTIAALPATAKLIADLHKCADIDTLELWPSYKDDDIKALPDDQQTLLRDAYREHKRKLADAPAPKTATKAAK